MMAADDGKEEGVLDAVRGIVASALGRGYLGGELQAAFRQGANELGEALKAFPDSIQVDEPGAVFSPLYRDMAGDPHSTAMGTPSMAADCHGGLPTLPIEVVLGAANGLIQKAMGTVHGPAEEAAKDAGTVLSQEKSWTDAELEREQKRREGNGGEDQNERGKGRSLPDEQRQREQERGGRGR